MAHYAKLGANNKVIAVHVVADSDCQNASGVEAFHIFFRLRPSSIDGTQ